MEIKAQAKFVKGSARKARLVADAVRGMKATYAMDVLKYMQKGAAPKVRKVLQSALANAVHNDNLDPESLVITKIVIDDAPMFKRMRIESKSRSRMLLKRNSHITVILGTKEARVDTKKSNAKLEAANIEKAEAAAEKSEKKPVKAKTVAKKAAAKKPVAKKSK